MKWLTVLLAFTLLWALSASWAAGDNEGVVEGRVINATEGGGSVADLEVTLSSISGAAAPVVTHTNPLGQFRFEALPVRSDSSYTVGVRYEGVDYAVGSITMGADSPLRQVELYVYETTTSAQAVRVLLDHHIVEASPQDQRLNVVNYIELTNASDRTVVAPQGAPGATESPLFAVPEAAENLELLEGSSQHVSSGATGLSLKSIPPGEHQLVLAYTLRYRGGSFAFRKPLNYPTEKAVFLTSAQDAQAESRQLPTVKEVDSAAGPYRLLSGENLSAGSVLEVGLTNLATESGTALDDILRPAAAVLVLLAIGAIVVYVRYQRRRASTQPSG